MSNNIIHLNDAIAFEETVINSADPVLVDFWAEWCGPCKMIAPLLDEIADEYLNKLTIAKVDVDAIPEISEKYGIRGIPTLILFKEDPTINQKVCAATKVGAVSKKQLKTFLDENLD